MSDSLFTKIIQRKIPADFIHEDETCIVIRDIQPQAPVHLLVIPKKHIQRIADTKDEDVTILGHLLLVARQVALKEGLKENGFRVVINNGPHAGETVPHLHVHVLGGAPLANGWGSASHSH